ncbi:MAG TPA: hypothetical protein VMD07_01325, partial [Candidatus Acidoferrales bacterium]|nr:hypothetical protein [Candidatus Acidoferrales bacterium]
MILSIVAAPAAASAEGLSVEALLQRVLPSVARIVSDDDANPDTESVGSGVVLVHSAGAVDVLTAAHVIKSKR